MLASFLLSFSFHKENKYEQIPFCFFQTFFNEHKINLKIWNSKQAERKGNHEIYSSSCFSYQTFLIPISLSLYCSYSIPTVLYIPRQQQINNEKCFSIPHIVYFHSFCLNRAFAIFLILEFFHCCYINHVYHVKVSESWMEIYI